MSDFYNENTNNQNPVFENENNSFASAEPSKNEEAPAQSAPVNHGAFQNYVPEEPAPESAPKAEENSYTYAYTKNNLYDSGKTEVAPGTQSAQNPYTTQQNGYTAPAAGYTPYSNNSSTSNQSAAQNPYRQNSTYNPYAANAQSNANEKKKKKKEKKTGLTVAGAAILCVCCVMLSFSAGILGSAIVSVLDNSTSNNELKPGDTENNATADVDENGNVVLYRAVDTVKEDGSEMTLPEIANLVSASVVEISTEFASNSNSFFGQYVNEGAGSGVIISEDGYIVTNNHVIYDSDSGKTADKINVRLRDGTSYEAKLVGRDNDADLAVIKVNGKDLTAAVWGNSSKLVVGQQIVVVGNPLGELGGTVTDGIISATSREVQVENVKMTLLQTNAAVNPGNSGGGMFNEKGELVGIINAKSSGTGVEGLGFAIPADDARDVVEQILNYGYVKGKVYIGVSFYEANSGYSFYDESSTVLYVYSVEEGYNDDVLQSRDIVLTVEGEEVSTAADVKAILKKHKVGDKITFSILRNKEAMDVEVTCYEYTPDDKSVSFDD